MDWTGRARYGWIVSDWNGQNWNYKSSQEGQELEGRGWSSIGLAGVDRTLRDSIASDRNAEDYMAGKEGKEQEESDGGVNLSQEGIGLIRSVVECTVENWWNVAGGEGIRKYWKAPTSLVAYRQERTVADRIGLDRRKR